MQDKDHSIISCNVMAFIVTAMSYIFVVSIYFDAIIRWYNRTSLSINVITDLLFLSLLVLICAVVGIFIFCAYEK
jgi:uncharacterized membrane protein YesL